MKPIFRILLSSLLLLFLWLATGLAARAQAPAWQMALAVGSSSAGSNLAHVQASAADAGGNILLAGYFKGTVSVGGFTLTSVNGSEDVFVAKYNPATATMLWAKQAGGSGNERATALASAGTSLYMAGNFNGTAVFGTIALTGGDDIFVVKLTDAGPTADFVWGQRGGSPALDVATSVAVSGTNVYVAGGFQSYRNGTTTIGATFGATTLFNLGSNNNALDVFVAKIVDAGSTSSYAWAQRAGSVGNDQANGLAVNGSNVYLTGYFETSTLGSSADFGSITVTGNPTPAQSGTPDIFVAKLTDAGATASFTWALGVGAASNDQARALSVSGSTVYVAGDFDSPLLTFGTLPLTQAGAGSSFLAKLTDAGSTGSFVWVQGAATARTINLKRPSAIALNGANLYVTGYDGALGQLFITKTTDQGAYGSFQWEQTGAGAAFPLALTFSGTSVYASGYLYASRSSYSFSNQVIANPSLNELGFVAAINEAPPTLTAIAPASGRTGSSVTLTGTNLLGATAIAFAGTAFNVVTGGFTSNAAGTQITGVVVPTGAQTGAVTVTGPTGTSNGMLFTVTTVTATLAGAAPIAQGPYPNPAHGTTTLPLAGSFKKMPVSLLDALGREVRCYPAPTGPEATLDLRGLPAGLYVLRTGAGSGQKLVVE